MTLSLLFATLALALPEADLGIARDAYTHLEDFSQDHVFTGEAGVRIHSLEYVFPGTGGVVAIVPGRTESAGKYFEVAYDLGKGGASRVFVLDHRGQGLSGRLLADPLKGHVDDFRNYTLDLEHWLNEVVLPLSKGKSITLVAHSMGGAITAGYLAGAPEAKRARFNALVLTAPMFGIAWLGSWAEKLAEWNCRSGSSTCFEFLPASSGGDSFRSNAWTSSQARYELNAYFYSLWPQAKISGPTWGWLRQALRATRELQEHPKLEVPFPIVLFQAEDEKIVDNASQDAFCRAQTQCELVKVPGARHSILEDRDASRAPVLEKILRFVSPSGRTSAR